MEGLLLGGKDALANGVIPTVHVKAQAAKFLFRPDCNRLTSRVSLLINHQSTMSSRG
jgi:hypothetical protein